MASVYLASEKGPEQFCRLVAVKQMHPHLACERQYVEMFLDEAEIAAKLDHPYTVRILDFGKANNQYFIAMEYIVGETLAKVVSASAGDGSGASVPFVVRIIADLCEGLHAAHELRNDRGELLHVVHRDISPQNLFVLFDGTVRLIDFGVAHRIGGMHQSTAWTARGKFSYMAPEQLRDGKVDRRTDVWAMGVVLWEMLTKKRLFRRDSEFKTALAVSSDPIPLMSRVNRSIPRELDLIVSKALSRNPDERYATARALGADLSRFLHRQANPVGHAEVSAWLDDLFPTRQAHHRRLLSFARGSSVPPTDRESVTVVRAQSKMAGTALPHTSTLDSIEASTRTLPSGMRPERAGQRWPRSKKAHRFWWGAFFIGAALAILLARRNAGLDRLALVWSRLAMDGESHPMPTGRPAPARPAFGR
jgi:serine/threonine-protein kinase